MPRTLPNRDILLRELNVCCEDFVRGSITHVCAKCNRMKCKCEKATSKRAYRLTYKIGNQKTRIAYIAKHRLPEVKKMLASYGRARQIIEDLIELNIRVFKNDAKKTSGKPAVYGARRRKPASGL